MTPETLEPFFERCSEVDGGAFVLVRTSNPASGELQLHGEPTLSMRVAATVDARGRDFLGERSVSSIGAVVGATHPEELESFRAAMPHTPFLLPGYGAQGAGAKDIAPAFADAQHPWRGGVINSSRGIAFAWRKSPELDWKDASSRALDHMIAEIADALGLSANLAR